jgi:4-hydroxy-tetrahydrodipicolinate reductase
MSKEAAIRVAVAGAAGRMGREVVRAVHEADGLLLAAAIDRVEVGKDAGEVAGIGTVSVPIESDLKDALLRSQAEVLVDFTVPASAMANIQTALEARVSPVVGTTGLTAEDLNRVREWVSASGVGALIAPNFAIGAVLMMLFAEQAAKYLPDAEIIELHHENKLDSPSGTALMTAQKIAAARSASPRPEPADRMEKIPGGRGANYEGIHLHSVRLPGYVAHQEVIFGGLGQTLTIRHDSTDRRSFMPGVILAIRRVRTLPGLVIGLEHLL